MSISHRYLTRNRHRIDHTIPELAAQLPPSKRSTRVFPSINMSNTQASPTTVTNNLNTFDLHPQTSDSLSNHDKKPLLSSQSRSPANPSTFDRTCFLQAEVNALKKQMESIPLQEHPIDTPIIDPINHSESHHSLPQPITHSPWHVSSMLTSLPYVRNIDPLQQLKNFVKPFRGIDTDDVVQWIESVIRFLILFNYQVFRSGCIFNMLPPCSKIMLTNGGLKIKHKFLIGPHSLDY